MVQIEFEKDRSLESYDVPYADFVEDFRTIFGQFLEMDALMSKPPEERGKAEDESAPNPVDDTLGLVFDYLSGRFSDKLQAPTAFKIFSALCLFILSRRVDFVKANLLSPDGAFSEKFLGWAHRATYDDVTNASSKPDLTIDIWR
ncbi:MAG: hypothetical protein NUW37_09945 [Planctomycetes bacterium]|nr:hypothetical protein [Planctomycetota bacterium]